MKIKIYSCRIYNREFQAFIAPFDQKINFSGGSGVNEIFEVLEELKSGSRPTKPTLAKEGTVIGRITSDSKLMQPCEIWALSPSDSQFYSFLKSIGDLIPKVKETKKRCTDFSPNDLSLVTLFKIGNLGILYGADLENTNQFDTGWSAIINSSTKPDIKCQFFKIPHHGSENGHHDSVWTDMLHEKTVSIATPYARGRKKLPSDNDKNRILGLSSEFYMTSSGLKASKNQRSRAVEKTIKETAKLTSTVYLQGIVQIRNGGSSYPESWTVELSKEAFRVA